LAPLCRCAIVTTIGRRRGEERKMGPPSPGAGEPEAAVIWDKRGSPTRHVSDVLKIERWRLRAAIHKIKAGNNLGGADKVIIHSDGKVTDVNGNEIGNVFDEI
jgi:hypothetical protein